ncbi:MAG: arginine--tRNA ligase [Actinomycetota bacterium]
MIQRRLAAWLTDALLGAQKDGVVPKFDVPAVEMERPRKADHGDWATGIAMVCARPSGMPPRELAQIIIDRFGEHNEVQALEIAGPGFINIRLSHAWLTEIVREVITAGQAWGRSQPDEPTSVQVEFVSANPTGPMHIGHGRWAALGDTMARLLEWSGHEVSREFYINDFGVQMRKFAESIAARYDELQGREAEVPEGGYQGAYVKTIAAEIYAEIGARELDADEEERLNFFRAEGQRRMLLHQRSTLETFGVVFDKWFSERSLHEQGAVQRVVELLAELGHTYEHEGATWLRTTDFGDDKDRVIVRSTDGMPAYLAADLAYFLDKLRRGFEKCIYLVGADHHGWKREMEASIKALGEDPDAHCEFLIGQMVHLERGGQPVKMSKRTGEAITFDELIEEVGVDATRYHFLRVSMDQTLRFDLDEVISQTQENPVFYVQYAHARIHALLRRASESGIEPTATDQLALHELQHDSELDLLRKIAEFPEVVEVAARLRAPHRVTRFAEELAAAFHAFYRDCRVVDTQERSLTAARLGLAEAARITLANALAICGVSAPEAM